MKTLLIVTLSLVMGCHSPTTKSTVQPRILIHDSFTTPPDALVCWFTENDGSGQRGYAAVDSRFSFLQPRGGGLFKTIEQLRNEIRRSNLRFYLGRLAMQQGISCLRHTDEMLRNVIKFIMTVKKYAAYAGFVCGCSGALG